MDPKIGKQQRTKTQKGTSVCIYKEPKTKEQLITPKNQEPRRLTLKQTENKP